MEDPGRISIREVNTPEEFKQEQAIPVEILETEQGLPHDMNIDGMDQSAEIMSSDWTMVCPWRPRE